MTDDAPDAIWIPTLRLGGEATTRQRQRNFALYKRLESGDGSGDFRSIGLSSFVFEVSLVDTSRAIGGKTIDGKPGALTFRLDKDSDCFRRLLHVISDHFDTRCDADDEVARLRAVLLEVKRGVDAGSWEAVNNALAGVP